ncbi:MAG TPA: DCC1-like thiol-disulfide oxidoreductase family protein [Polyangiaceae bacterium]|nr:DCC1-like thiol-disulfide oxidoreductase family protein [Polyangiaceae bacterium]
MSRVTIMKDDDLPPRIVLFDGVCGLCSHLVRWFVQADRAQMLRYAPLQGPTAERLRALHPEIPTNIDTMVFVDQGRVHLRAQGILTSIGYLPPPLRWGRFLRWVPPFVSDAAYRIIAHFRYRLFGKSDVCTVPAPEERLLFLP